MSAPGILHLIPVTLGGNDPSAVLPATALAVVRTLDDFVVENEKSARSFLRQAGHLLPIAALHLERLDEHTKADAIEPLLAPLLAGKPVALLSEAGCPAIADPGAALVAAAHAQGIRVQPHVGPSAILLALMGSGLNGQRFAFHGYLPVEKTERRKRIHELERAAAAATQIFIETPYRTDTVLAALLEHCRPDTRLSLAVDLTLPGEFLATRTIRQWRQAAPTVGRRPAVFLLGVSPR